MAQASIVQMGVDVKRRMGRLSTAVERGRRDTVTAAAKAAKVEQEQRIRRDSGGDMRLSGVGKRGARVGARYDIRGDRAVVRATGPLHLRERDTSPHRIPKQRSRRARRRWVVIPGVGVRAWANHPGTRGVKTWTRGRTAAKPKVDRAVTEEFRNIVKRAM